MRKGKIVSSDQTRKKIQEALKKKNNLSLQDGMIAPEKIHELNTFFYTQILDLQNFWYEYKMLE